MKHTGQRAGLYWVRFFPDDTEWQPAHHEAGEWWLIGVADPQPRVAEVGPEITRHVEESRNSPEPHSAGDKQSQAD